MTKAWKGIRRLVKNPVFFSLAYVEVSDAEEEIKSQGIKIQNPNLYFANERHRHLCDIQNGDLI